jgi:hypothetical protein
MRLGVVVLVHVPGAVVHRLELLAVRVRPRRLFVEVRNRGNVVEELGPRSLHVVLRRRGRVLAERAAAPRELLPGTRGLAEVARPSRLRGRTVALVEARDGAGVRVRRSFRVRLPVTERGG